MRRGPVVLAAAVACVALAASGPVRPAGSTWTDAVTAVGSVSARTVPAPTGLNCPALGLGSASIRWTAVPGATAYEIYRGSTYEGTTTDTQFGAGFLVSNSTYTIVTTMRGWRSPTTSRVTVTVILILVSCSATA